MGWTCSLTLSVGHGVAVHKGEQSGISSAVGRDLDHRLDSGDITIPNAYPFPNGRVGYEQFGYHEVLRGHTNRVIVLVSRIKEASLER